MAEKKIKKVVTRFKKLFRLKNGDYIKLSDVTGVNYMPMSQIGKDAPDNHYCVIERCGRSTSVVFDDKTDAKNYVTFIAEKVNSIKN